MVVLGCSLPHRESVNTVQKRIPSPQTRIHSFPLHTTPLKDNVIASALRTGFITASPNLFPHYGTRKLKAAVLAILVSQQFPVP